MCFLLCSSIYEIQQDRPKYSFPLVINEQDFSVELPDIDVPSIESSVREFCSANGEKLNIRSEAIEEGCFKPIARHILFETRQLRAKLATTSVPDTVMEVKDHL